MPTHIIIKLLKIKDIGRKRKQLEQKHFYRGNPMQMTADFSSEITKAEKTAGHFQSAEREN